ncbi:MAG: SPFH domain-containing protein [Planctomycetota bacterium]|nr:SPFH domain-containing protein [Planctomycetota bacterium]
MGTLFGFSLLLVVGAIVGALLLAFIVAGVRYVPNNRVGIVEKRFGGKGSVESGLIALRGEAGFQPDVLRGGLHWLMPLQYAVHRMPLVTIPQGKVGYVFSRDGKPLEPTQTLGSNTNARDFENVREFLASDGQRGPQRQILREGTYAINLAQFVVITQQMIYFLRLDRDDTRIFEEMAEIIAQRGGFDPVVIKGTEDVIGIVTVHDGPALSDGQIIAPVVGGKDGGSNGGHNSFQDPEQFLALGGRRGRQLQVLVEGTYYINRLFATIEYVEKTVVDVGHVGVVVSYTGETGKDLSGSEYSHGELVEQGRRGVWNESLLPGKYAFNTYAGKVFMVPTTNFMLKWIRSEAGEHAFDKNLSEVSLITKDAFEPSLPLSVVVHIDYRKAPLVIQRFGDIRQLVEQTLDPMVAAYFKNIAQNRTLIQLLQDRSDIQTQAAQEMRAKFAMYNLELNEVLIGTPKSPQGAGNKIEAILEQLRSRQIAQEQIETYAQQEKAAKQERELRQAEALAHQQTKLTESELAITIQTNQGKAEYQRALQQASQVKAMADAEAARVKMLAEAEAEKNARVGVAQAIAVEEQVRAYGGPVYQLTQSVLARFAEAIQQSKVDVVPKIVIGGGDGKAAGGNVMEALLTMMLSEKMLSLTSTTPEPPRPEVTQIRESILKSTNK